MKRYTILFENKKYVIQIFDSYNFAIRKKKEKPIFYDKKTKFIKRYEDANLFFGRLEFALRKFHNLIFDNLDYPKEFKEFKNIKANSKDIDLTILKEYITKIKEL